MSIILRVDGLLGKMNGTVYGEQVIAPPAAGQTTLTGTTATTLAPVIAANWQ
jgi:hypothetical protein